jgi:SAM-dependent methyltransferase
MSLRYVVGYSFVVLARLLRRVFAQASRVVALPEHVALILWTPSEIARYARNDWNSRASVRSYARMDRWLSVTEHVLVERYFSNNGEALNLACGAGREAVLLAGRGLRVTACDWSPRMIAEARRRAREANLPVRLTVADLMDDLPYRERAFDYLLMTNIAYSYIFPSRRRVRFLGQAHSVLRPGGVFIVSFAPARGNPGIQAGPSEWLFMRLRGRAPFNREYELGDRLVAGTFVHFFRSQELAEEFQEPRFLIKEWLWDQGYAVLVKL